MFYYLRTVEDLREIRLVRAGEKDDVPPASARTFAAESCGLMGLLYPSARCISATGAATLPEEDGPIVPWGWDMTLKGWLLRQGVPERMMPSDAMLADWRELQHRTSWLPLQPNKTLVSPPSATPQTSLPRPSRQTMSSRLKVLCSMVVVDYK